MRQGDIERRKHVRRTVLLPCRVESPTTNEMMHVIILSEGGCLVAARNTFLQPEIPRVATAPLGMTVCQDPKQSCSLGLQLSLTSPPPPINYPPRQERRVESRRYFLSLLKFQTVNPSRVVGVLARESARAQL